MTSRRLVVTSDPHGYLDSFRAALTSAGVVNDHGDWAAGDARLYVLGDLLDRGPDGVGVVDLVMRLQAEAEEVSGQVVCLLGNHEVLALGMRRYGDRQVSSDTSGSFFRSWVRNGGLRDDQEQLTEAQHAWLLERPAMALVDDHLLVHSDTLEYVTWGDTIDEVNASVASVLGRDDLDAWWDLWCRLTTRYVFAGEDGTYQARGMLDRYGGDLLVHGHTLVGDFLDIPSEQVKAPYLYADDLVMGVDGGSYDGGPHLVVDLPHHHGDVVRP